jgi:hypothetical protein
MEGLMAKVVSTIILETESGILTNISTCVLELSHSECFSQCYDPDSARPNSVA